MTPAQLATLKSAILASQDVEILAFNAARNATDLAKKLNAPSTFYVWRIDVPATELVGAIKLANFTPLDAPDDTLLYANHCHLCELKQNNIRMILSRDVVTTQKLSTRQDLTDALTNVPAGAGGAAIDAGWLGVGKTKDTISRVCTVAERAFATGTGTAGQPGDLGWQGQVTINDLGEMWNL